MKVEEIGKRFSACVSIRRQKAGSKCLDKFFCICLEPETRGRIENGEG